MEKILTNRQKEILEFIAEFIRQNGYPPTVREIGEACRLRSPRSVSQHLNSLEKKGCIRRKRDKSRAIELTDSKERKIGEALRAVSVNTVPLIGRVPAGDPALAWEDYEASYALDENLFGEDGAFLLRAVGESMVDAHIVEGDLLLIKPQPSAESGDVVVAMIDDEATVKRFMKSGGKAFLVPENKAMKPIRLSSKNGKVRLVGRVVGIIRRLK